MFRCITRYAVFTCVKYATTPRNCWTHYPPRYSNGWAEFSSEPMKLLVDKLNHAHWLRIFIHIHHFRNWHIYVKEVVNEMKMRHAKLQKYKNSEKTAQNVAKVPWIHIRAPKIIIFHTKFTWIYNLIHVTHMYITRLWHRILLTWIFGWAWYPLLSSWPPVLMLWGGGHFDGHIWRWVIVPPDLERSFAAIYGNYRCRLFYRAMAYMRVWFKSTRERQHMLNGLAWQT